MEPASAARTRTSRETSRVPTGFRDGAEIDSRNRAHRSPPLAGISVATGVHDHGHRPPAIHGDPNLGALRRQALRRSALADPVDVGKYTANKLEMSWQDILVSDRDRANKNEDYSIAANHVKFDHWVGSQQCFVDYGGVDTNGKNAGVKALLVQKMTNYSRLGSIGEGATGVYPYFKNPKGAADVHRGHLLAKC
jgi:hypothetical protein